ncbi:MAG: hypothetical protein L0Z62_03870, partial [Gemmataceae bacterium]|nr:hypothetical protein [Gemmataceae bacterium]
MQYAIDTDSQAAELNERLRMEPGWNEVASGLGSILIGYLVFFVGTAAGVGLILWSIFNTLSAGGGRVAGMPSIGTVWIFYIGLGILSIVGTFGYLIVLAGHWRCMHGAAERHGARWLMFFCVTALFAGPALEVASYISGCQKGPELSRGASSFNDMQFTRTARYMQLAGAGATLLYTVLFLLFLRSVALCHGSRRHALLVNFFLLLMVLLVGGTVYVGYLTYTDPRAELARIRLGLIGAWGAIVLFYLILIGVLRGCILRSVA